MKRFMTLLLALMFTLAFISCGSETDLKDSSTTEDLTTNIKDSSNIPSIINTEDSSDILSAIDTVESSDAPPAASIEDNSKEEPTSYTSENAVSSHPAVKIGDRIKFSDSDWIVLDVKDEKMLVLREKVIEHMAYHSAYKSATWETSDLRQYLNNEYYQSFNKSDMERIIETKTLNNDNPWYKTSGGNDTDDYIFLLSIEEVVEYFGDSGQLSNRPLVEWGYTSVIEDQYNTTRKALDKSDVASWWWLRSSGSGDRTAAYVYDDGRINIGGGANRAYVGFTDEAGGVRPALWLDID